MSWCDLNLTFDLTVVTLTYKILSGLYLGNHKVQEVDTWWGHCLVVVGVQHHGVTLILPLSVTMSFKILSGLFLGFHKV